jgi:hypothetical protein
MTTPRRKTLRFGAAFSLGGAAIMIATAPALPTISGAVILACGAYVLGTADTHH